ncbi:hypothetical protein FE697_006725 [Mumia zhuanghuii]|uniref:Uncharacterized protein n=2 Tax=Mumia TaxID=1546255 RepID=A0ABW1QPS0_9ACTN|nr:MULTISPECIES: hypothetical protein [Mumia]KAA1423310.1 hypothetical protein FE697_006725 [Mumia zhuanghuii]
MTTRFIHPHHSAPDPPDRSTWQKVRNVSWPFHDQDDNGHARGIPSRTPILIMVWLDFEHDGLCWLPAQAVRWHRDRVCVYLSDDRLAVPYVWVAVTDVQRR